MQVFAAYFSQSSLLSWGIVRWCPCLPSHSSAGKSQSGASKRILFLKILILLQIHSNHSYCQQVQLQYVRVHSCEGPWSSPLRCRGSACWWCRRRWSRLPRPWSRSASRFGTSLAQPCPKSAASTNYCFGEDQPFLKQSAHRLWYPHPFWSAPWRTGSKWTFSRHLYPQGSLLWTFLTFLLL